MKVWFPTIQTGSGSDIYVKRLSDGLNKKGIDVEVTWFPHYYEFLPRLLSRIPPPTGTDIIHANSWSAFAFKKPNIKLVTTVHHCVHDPEYACYRNSLQSIYHNHVIYHFEKRSFKVADTIIAVSEYTRSCVNTIFNSVEPVVIYNGVDVDLYSPDKINVQKTEKFRLLFVGNKSKRKGYDLLSPIMKKLGEGFELYCVSGLRNNVGPKDHSNISIKADNDFDMSKIYGNCDALLFPTRYEGFGYVLCEAMATGIPVVSSKNSAVTEIVENNSTGILCETNNVTEFCDGIKRISANKNYAKELGDRARKHVSEYFSLDKMIDSYIRIYESIL